MVDVKELAEAKAKLDGVGQSLKNLYALPTDDAHQSNTVTLATTVPIIHDVLGWMIGWMMNLDEAVNQKPPVVAKKQSESKSAQPAA